MVPLWFRTWLISFVKQNIRSFAISLKNMEKPLPNAYIERVMDPRAQGRWN
jgi:hypothetical protein